jgi:RNA polymerase sigma factor (sigma-70 family)
VAAGAPELAAGVLGGMTDDERLLDELRPFAFAIAYRLLGSVSEAEDVIQEALLRVHQALQAGEEIASPRAYVATVTTRLGINELRSARARRERYVGEWLPEPIITDGHDDPAPHAETADSLSLAMLVLLESLSPEQRAVLLLHDVFDYRYPERAPALAQTLRGRTRVAPMLINYGTTLSARIPQIQVRPTEINGSRGALVLDSSERVIGVAVLDIGGDQIQGISAIVNPDKLAHLAPRANPGFLLRTRASRDERPASEAVPTLPAGQPPKRSTSTDEEPNVNGAGNQQQNDVQALP